MAAKTKLAKYRSMRDFAVTDEPSGDATRSAHGKRFVIQAHAARRMHYDFRLELDGVLLSWSVPKGPSLSPTERRLAVRTEDHPIDYADFEGIIPAGQYGGGTVVVWDQGTWEPEGDARASMAKGRLTFAIHGAKLRGRWHLVKTRGDGKAENWLLFKGRDAEASDDKDIVAERPESVVSGRTLDEVAADADRVWHSNRGDAKRGDTKRSATSRATSRATKNSTKPAKAAAKATAAMSPTSLVEQLPLGFTLTNLDKVLYPPPHDGDAAITKGQLLAYLAVVSDWILPHLARRPLTLVRCPEGIQHGGPVPRGASSGGKRCFFQKKILAGSPSAIKRVPLVEADGERVDYMQITDMEGLLGLAQLGSLELHTWGSRADDIERPDVLVFDVDPDEGLDWNKVALAAFELRRELGALGLTSFVKTTGGKGLHVVVPIEPTLAWDDAKAFCKAFVEKMEREAPASYTTNIAKAARRGRIFLDYLRNGRGATFVAPYSPRARPGAPVATPIAWEELAHGVDPRAFTTATVPRRLAALDEDPWRDYAATAQAITAEMWRAVDGEPPAVLRERDQPAKPSRHSPRAARTAGGKPRAHAKPRAKAAPRVHAKPRAKAAHAKPRAARAARKSTQRKGADR